MPFINIPAYGSASWKEAVSAVIDLPASGNSVGDTRVVETTSEIYIWDGSTWNLASGGGGGADTFLSNLTAPTAINEDLNLGVNAISQTNYIISPQLYDAGTQTTNFTLDWANGPAQKLVINAAGPLVITLSNPVTGGTYLVRIEQGATPGTVTWPSSVKWGTVGAPVLSNATGEVDVVTLFYDGVDYRASAVIQDAPPAANYSLTNLSFAGSTEQVLALGSGGVPYWATEGVKTGYPANTVIVGRLKPAGLTGTDNILIGSGAGNSLTTGLRSIAIGTNSLAALTTRSADTGIVAVGYEALQSYTNSSTRNPVAIGYKSARLNTDSNLTAVGAFTFSLVTGGGALGSVAMGHFAGYGQSGGNNVFIGERSGEATGTGGGNVGVGRATFFNLTSGTNNVAIGLSANSNLTTGSNNVCVGAESGSSGSNAIVLGHLATAASNEFAIGSATSQINTMLLGRGGASQTAANAVTIMTMRASGTDTNLSAGTLTLAGSQSTGNQAGGAVIISTAPAGASGTTLNAHVERMRVTAAGDVGIGTSTPNAKLEVQNTTATTNAVTNVLRVDSQSSGTPAVGIGVGIQMSAETAAGNTEVGVVLEAVTTDVTAASEDFDLVVKNMTNGAAATEKVRVASTGTVTVANGDLVLNTAGNGINIKEGANARMGITDVFPTGNPNTVTVSTTEVTANSRIFLTAQTNPAGNPVELYISARNAGTDFSITAHSNSFDGAVAWLIMEPA